MLVMIAGLILCLTLVDVSSVNPVGDDAAVQADSSAASYDPQTIIVELKPQRTIQGVAGRYNLVVLEEVDERIWLLGIPQGRTVEQVMSELRADRDVKSVEPNYLLQIPEINQRTIANVDGPGSSAAYAAQPALSLLGVMSAQAVADGRGVVVAVIDTGIDVAHPALGSLTSGYDFVDRDSDPSEVSGGIGYGHGTLVAGLIKLVAPGVTIMPVRAFGPDGRGTASNIAKAIRYAAQNGADVINLSFGTLGQPQAMRGVMNLALRRAIVVTAAGNSNTNWPVPYPASVEEAMTIAATDLSDYKAALSNYGAHVDLCAPGVELISAFPGGGFASASGTSFSAALASGAVALVKSSGRANAAQAVLDSAVNIDGLNPGYRGMLGRGRLDVLAAVSR
ncbi:MAG: S8 family serine peptidase [Acidobacteriota bacterium]|nr:S8 family serine peptidase [Blastocatellia bacterium]MDW8239450.1 S8 family serine peptidase [Acidobacteriota bacterium]